MVSLQIIQNSNFEIILVIIKIYSQPHPLFVLYYDYMYSSTIVQLVSRK